LAPNQLDFAKIPVPLVPVLSDKPGKILARIKPAKGDTIAFRLKPTKDAPEISLIPFYRLHHERYAVYWKISTPLVSPLP